MKKKLLHSLGIFMAFAVLFSSTGFGMTTHTCKITQKKQFFIHGSDGCCKSSESTEPLTLKKSDCCKVEKSFNKILVNHTITGKMAVQPPDLLLTETDFYPRFIKLVYLSQLFNSETYANPPPLYGKNLLILIHTFLI